jgi:hypothetical protein
MKPGFRMPDGGPVTMEEVNRDLMELGGLTDQQFARLFSIEKGTVGRWRRGDARVKSPRQYRWAIRAVKDEMARASGASPAEIARGMVATAALTAAL